MIGPRNAADLPDDHPLKACPVEPGPRGLPIPAVTVHLPDSKAYDLEHVVPVPIDHPDAMVKWDAIYAPTVFELGVQKRCALCAEPFKIAAFLGGPSTLANGRYNDGPMHPECAVASMTLCPHLRLGNHRRSAESRAQGIEEKSEQMILLLAVAYSIELRPHNLHFVVDREHVIGGKVYEYMDGEVVEVL